MFLGRTSLHCHTCVVLLDLTFLHFYFDLTFPVFFLSSVLMHPEHYTDLDNLDTVENNLRHSAKGSNDAYDVTHSLTVFEQKYPVDTVLVLDADDDAPDDEVVKEAEAVTVEGQVVDFPEVDADRKDEATLRDVVAEEVLVPARGAPSSGWRVDRFPQGPGRMRLVSTPLWSLRPPTCEPELWLIIGKPAQRER